MPKARPIPAAVPRAPLHANASLPVMVRLEELVGYDAAVRDPANVEEIHDMRIAVKRLRYTLEIYSGVIEGAEAFLKTLKSLQELLGAIHDADVLLPLLEGGIARDRGAPGIDAVYEHAVAERGRLYEEFLRAWDTALNEGFPITLWNAALAASAAPDGPAHNAAATNGPLPPEPARRVHLSVAMLRLVPWAAASASPERMHRLESAIEGLHTALSDHDTDGKAWRKAARRLGSLISADEP